jgi:hypothetical protein
MWPLTLTSAAAMWLGSRSSPTTDWLFLRFLLSTLLVSASRDRRLSGRAQLLAVISRNEFWTMPAVPKARRRLATLASYFMLPSQ